MDKFHLFKDVKSNVEAYREFLKEHGADNVSRWDDIPIMTKENYLLKHPITKTVREGSFNKCFLIGSSSGFSKTGSVFWPKRASDEASYMKIVEESLKSMYGVDKKKTLVIVSLAFGTWIGGMQLACCMRRLATKSKYYLTTALSGLDLKEGVLIAKQFRDVFEQIIWVTNASNVSIIYSLLKDDKELLDGRIYFPVVGEYFTESYREDMAVKFGHTKDKENVMWTGYGSADTGDLAVETKSTINLRKYLHKNPGLSKKIFGVDDAPIIMEFSKKVYIEIIDGNIVVTKNQFVPLIRYNTKDSGGILNKETLKNVIPQEIYDAIPDKLIYIFGRASDSIIFYGTNLKIPEIETFLYSLGSELQYSGLFEIEQKNENGIDIFLFTIYTLDGDKSKETVYKSKLVEFFKSSSREFSAKYDNLVKSARRELISVEIKPIGKKESSKKHRFIKS